MASTPQNLYAPPKSTVADPTSSEPFELAERGSRLGAVVLDGLIFGVPLVPIYMPLLPQILHGGRPRLNPTGTWGLFAAIAGFIEIGLFIYTLVLLNRNGQTIGKKIVDIKIVRTDGSRASLGRIFWLRGVVSSLPGIIPILGHLYRLADVLFIFGNARRCIHDYIADTIVVKA